MARIPGELIRSVLDSVDIVDVISRYVTLKRSGSSHKGLCPFHEEKTPSFHVFPNSGRFKCFGCGEGGDAAAFLMRRQNIGFVDALEELARDAGIALPREEQTPEEQQRQRRRSAALSALEFAARFYRAVYARDAGAPARDYMEGRGYGPATVEAFGIGYAPDEFEGLLAYARRKGLSEEALFEAGLIRRNERGKAFDMFRGRIIFPIHGLRGQVIGFGARALGDAQPKYLNSPDGALFHKGREMYGLHLARPAALKAGRLLVVEGYTDVMSCHQAGLGEVAAGLGTALTPDNARQLRRFNVPAVLVYDGDEAGRRAAERAADVLLAEQVEGSVALLPPGEDPAELVAREGVQGLEASVAQSRDLWDYRMERALERHDPSSLDGRGRAVEELLGVIGAMADPLRRELALKLLSERVGVPEFTLRDQISPARRPRPVKEAETRPKSAAWRRAETDLVRAVLANEQLWERVCETYPPEEFSDPDLRRVAGAMRDLRQRGQSMARERLLGELADQDGAIRALQAMEMDENAEARALMHLDRIAQLRRLRSALATSDLEAVVRARRGDTSGAS